MIEKVSIASHQNTWIDGSLGDIEWWSGWIERLRSEHPSYRVAIFYVYCSDEEVYARAEQRGRATGPWCGRPVRLSACWSPMPYGILEACTRSRPLQPGNFAA